MCFAYPHDSRRRRNSKTDFTPHCNLKGLLLGRRLGGRGGHWISLSRFFLRRNVSRPLANLRFGFNVRVTSRSENVAKLLVPRDGVLVAAHEHARPLAAFVTIPRTEEGADFRVLRLRGGE